MFLKIREIHFDFSFAELLPSYPAQMLISEWCKVCKSCISLKMLKNNIKYYLKFTCKNRSRYSRERAPRSFIQYHSILFIRVLSRNREVERAHLEVKRGKTIPANQLTLPEMNVGNIQAELDKLEALVAKRNAKHG